MLDRENQIIENAVRGEASAFGLLYDYYHPKIYRFVLIKVGHREEAEDLTHQVFLNAWQNIGRYRDVGHPFSSWLYQIARNQITDFYRTTRKDVSLDAVQENYFVAPVRMDVNLDRSIEMRRVQEVLATLKPDYQDVIIMRFVEELSIKEVAAALGKSEGAVKLIQHRALGELKKKLGSQSYGITRTAQTI